MSTNEQSSSEWNRRDFLKGTSVAAMMGLVGAIPIHAEEKPAAQGGFTNYQAAEDPLKFGVIGCGIWGREIVKTLSTRPNAPVVALCDVYEPFFRRAGHAAPDAQNYTDYHKLLANKDVQAVVVATPSHLHKDIVIAALQAGKHVYCEAPMATTIEDARAIARAARTATRLNFQVGLQSRSDPQMTHLQDFLGTGVLGKIVKVRSQAHKKQMWRRTAPDPAREKAVNWRLDKDVSLGLIGEIGIHQLDKASWYLMGRPLAVTGYGDVMFWKQDGRQVPDTVQAVFEFPDGVVFNQECTIASSFDATYDLFYGSDSTIMVRDRHAWMFREPDAQILPWEINAHREMFYKESGIVLGANATKMVKPTDTTPDAAGPTALPETDLSSSLQHFLTNSLSIMTGVEDFVSSFGDTNKKALDEYLAGLAKNRQTGVTWREGYASAVLAIKAHEAIRQKQRIVFSEEWFQIA